MNSFKKTALTGLIAISICGSSYAFGPANAPANGESYTTFFRRAIDQGASKGVQELTKEATKFVAYKAVLCAQNMYEMLQKQLEYKKKMENPLYAFYDRMVTRIKKWKASVMNVFSK